MKNSRDILAYAYYALGEAIDNTELLIEQDSDAEDMGLIDDVEMFDAIRRNIALELGWSKAIDLDEVKKRLEGK